MKKKLVCIFICMLLTAGVFPIEITSADGTIIYVDVDNTSGPWDGTIEHPYQHIQDGINSSSNGDTVFVFDGTYYENVVVNRSIYLIGENKENTIINGSYGNVIQVCNSFVNINNFTVTSGGVGNGIRTINKNPRIENIHISDCIVKTNTLGIYFFNLTNSFITNCEINDISGQGIKIGDNTDNITINNCSVYDCYDPDPMSDGNAILVYDLSLESSYVNSNISISECDLHDSENGILMSDAKNVELYNNTIYSNYKSGIIVTGSSIAHIHHNTIFENKWKAISVRYGNNCIINNNNIFDNEYEYAGTIDGGILVQDWENGTVINNNISSNSESGICLTRSNNINVIGNNITNNTNNGIYMSRSSHNNIIRNTISNHYVVGLQLSNDCINNTIVGNTIINSYGRGMRISHLIPGSINNNIYHNNFVNTPYYTNVDDGCVNTWDDGYPSGGNYYWDDDYIGTDNFHGQNQDIPGGDGIGDEEYPIPEGDNKDNYPLMEPKYHPSLNFPPNKPRKPSGPLVIRKNVNYSFSTSTIDINDDQVYYMWDWGDGNYSDWLGPVDSGETYDTHHQWSKMGYYNIKVKAKDIYDEESEWSDPKGTIVDLSAEFIACPSVYLQPSQTIYFNDTSKHYYEIVNWTWDFGDENISYEQNFSHEYAVDGVYNVTLTVTDNQSNTDVYYQIVTVDSVPCQITNVSNSPDTIGFGFNTIITEDVTDVLSGIDMVKVNITYPDSSTGNFTMDNTGSNAYEYVFSDTWLVGQYNYTIWAVDNAGNSNSSSGHSFNVSYLFGYTESGASSEIVEDRITGTIFTINEYGVADNITVFINQYFMSPGPYKCMIYRLNDSKLIGNTSEDWESLPQGNPVMSSWWAVFNFSEPKPVLEKDTQYVLTCWGDNEYNIIYYDVVSQSNGRYDNETYGTPPDPANFTNESRVYSIYCRYTPDITLPEITNVSNAPDIVGFGFNVIINADVTDNISGVDAVKVNITYPDDSTGNFTMNNTVNNTYEYNFSDTWLVGQYNYTIWAVDNYGNSNSSSGYSFNVSAQCNISVQTLKDDYGGNEDINITDPPGGGGDSTDWIVVERGPNFIRRQRISNPDIFSWESATQWVYNGTAWVPYIYTETDNYYQVQSGLIGARIYKSGYAEFYSPDMTEVRLYEERWVLEYYDDNKWKTCDVYSPTFIVDSDDTSVNITASFITDYPNSGERVFDVKYIFREGKPLKHEIIFTSHSAEEHLFRVKQKWAGIVADKVKHSKGIDDNITSPIIINSSYFKFQKDDGNLSIFEDQWKMYYGYNDTTHRPYILEDQNLKPVEIDTHAQGLKADFIFGNWTLSQNESLEIDPDTTTLSDPTEDGDIMWDDPNYLRETDNNDFLFGCDGDVDYRAYVEWDVSSLAGVTLTANPVFKYEGNDDDGTDEEINPILEEPPSEAEDDDLYSYIATGDAYVDPFDVVQEPDLEEDLGADAKDDLQDAINAEQSWFAIGFQSPADEGQSGVRPSSIMDEEDIPTPPPTLYVEYTEGPSLEQEGFRFRNDDGNEAGATWIAEQDTNTERDKNTNTRLRILLNATGSIPSTQYQLEVKKSTDDTYLKVPTSLLGEQVLNYTSSDTWVAPFGVNSVQVEAWGGGGVGGRATVNPSGGGGGAGGAYAKKTISVTPGQSYAIVVAAARIGGGQQGNTGYPSYFDNGSQVYAEGGKGGWQNNGAGGVGSSASSKGDVVYAGGDGYAGTTTQGSPGGGGAGSGGEGGDATLTTAGSGTAVGGGNGGARRTTQGGGNDGSVAGGGGGGGLCLTPGFWTGGDGARGMVKLTFTPQPPILLSDSTNIAASGEDTTAQLTPPAGKTTGDFVAGRIQDDENPADAVSITTDNYTEMEWCFKITDFATSTDVYQFRITADGTPLDTYPVTPQLTYTAAPTQSNHKIWNATTQIEKSLNATDVDLYPTCFNVTSNDVDGDNMNVTVLTNESGGWTVVNQTGGSGLSNGTYSFTNTSWIDSYGKTYYISFNLTDGTDWSNKTYHFTTYYIQSKINNTGSTDIRGYLLIQVQYNDSGTWVVDNDTINETEPRTINFGEQLALDLIFNGNVSTDDLTFGDGMYRVYAAFRDPDGDVLICDDETVLEAWYEFEVDAS